MTFNLCLKQPFSKSNMLKVMRNVPQHSLSLSTEHISVPEIYGIFHKSHVQQEVASSEFP